MTNELEPKSAAPIDTGLVALVMVLRFLGVPADPDQIRHQFGGAPLGVTEILRCAKQLQVKARAIKTKWERLAATPLPAIAVLREGGFLLLGKAVDDKVLVQSPGSPKPAFMTRAEFEAVWDGRLVLMTRRASLSDLARKFDITWFVGAIHKYRRLLTEVLVASFFLQIFALVTPLFFQVVIDKVLVHRSLSTLDVLVIGLAAISLFEVILGILRTYLFAHTTNRIDVELGARLFRHLLALPIAYFQARRVGDTVARVRELENIRNFLTGSALTLVIDLFFTFVFLAVMYLYSPFLTLIVLLSLSVLHRDFASIATPIFASRLDEKFERGAENQAFLVESVTGVETLKAMAVEPQMQRRWEEQLAGYVAASFRVLSLGNVASQAVQLVSKFTTAAMLYFGARLVISGALTVGELVAFNMLAGRVSGRRAAARPAMAGLPSGPAVDRSGLATSSTPARAGLQRRPRRAADDPRRRHLRSCPLSLSARRARGAAGRQLSMPAGQVVGIVGPSGSGKIDARQAGAAALRARRAAACWSMASTSRWSTRPGCAARSASCCRRTCCSIARCATTSRSPIPPCRWTASSPPPSSPARTNSSSSSREGYDTVVGERGSEPVGRPAPAHRDRARADHQSADPDLRRGDQRARLRKRADHPAEHAGDRRRPHRADHRPPALDRAHGRPHHHDRARPDRRGRHA